MVHRGDEKSGSSDNIVVATGFLLSHGLDLRLLIPQRILEASCPFL